MCSVPSPLNAIFSFARIRALDGDESFCLHTCAVHDQIRKQKCRFRCHTALRNRAATITTDLIQIKFEDDQNQLDSSGDVVHLALKISECLSSAYRRLTNLSLGRLLIFYINRGVRKVFGNRLADSGSRTHFVLFNDE